MKKLRRKSLETGERKKKREKRKKKKVRQQ